MKKCDAFISFSFKDQNIVESVVYELENRYGITCWTCLEYVKSGQSYKELIPDAIKNSSVTVVFISQNSLVSTEVPKEVGIALRYEKTVIPFKLDNSEFSGKLEYDLEGINYIDATVDPFEERIKDLAKAISSFINKQLNPDNGHCTTTDYSPERNYPNKSFAQKQKIFKKSVSVFVPIVIAMVVIGCVLFSSFSDKLDSFGTTSESSSIDTIAPIITISEPSFSTGLVEFTLSVDENTEFVSINVDVDHVKTYGFTANLEVLDRGTTQILKFTDLEVSSDECQIALLEGIAIDASNNKSERCSSEVFYLDVTPPIMSIGPKDKNKIIKENDTAIYSVAVGDNNGIAAVSLNKENITMHGFTADISIKKTSAVTREITFSNIKLNSDSGSKYFEISEGIAADTYGNLNGPLKMYLKTK